MTLLNRYFSWMVYKENVLFRDGISLLCTHTTLFIVITIHYCIQGILTTLNMELGNSRARAVLL